ncbi:MAG TPA: prepilin-type N-terminal cleavage/methylation domain-containing protein [Candidatus Eisenbacteria bacterium]|nr:prepilin-type N-terminal cleavage/methylation domain-containing protein [Candidatus Eisenbacteria bacterium]
MRTELAPGFTLMELTIVIVIVGISAVVFAFAFRESMRAYELIDTETDLAQQARYAEERVTRHVLRTPTAGIRAASSTSITLLDPDSSVIRIAWDGVKGSDLVLTRGGIAAPLASHVDSLAFTYHGTDGRPLAPGRAGSMELRRLRRVSMFLRLEQGGHAVAATGAAALRVP